MSRTVKAIPRALRVCNLGSHPVEYCDTLDLQVRLASQVQHQSVADTLLQLQVLLMTIAQASF